MHTWITGCFLQVLLVVLLLRAPDAGAGDLRSFRTIKAEGGARVTLVLYRSADGSMIEFRARNSDPASYGIRISLELDNMEASSPLPFEATLEARPDEVPLFRISRIDDDAPFYYRNLDWRLSAVPMASGPVVHDGVYEYPWPKGKKYTVDNAFNGYGAHQGAWAYAVDFRMKVGSPVCAAREGTVIAVQDTFSKGGDDPELGDKANYVFIRHPDGSIGRYLHISKNGALVQVGQEVQAGDEIAKSGNVGWSTDPHLHFDVVLPDGDGGQKTVPFKFRRPDGRLIEPAAGMKLSH